MGAMVQIRVSSLYRVATADPSKGKTHKDATQSRSAIACVGQDEFEREYVLSAFAEQIPTSQFIEEIIKTWRTWRPRVFGIDATGPQGPFYDSLVMETRRRGMRIPFVALNLHGDKISRIEDTLEPSLSDGRLFVHPGMNSLHEEGRDFPTGFLDCLDCIAECKRLLPKRPTTNTKIAGRQAEIDSMKRQGLPFAQIMDRLALKYGR